jgi:2-polyprenyl-6-methoxyphenol hydroxylase-like FAD-dependent oxidoreductase
VLAGELGACGDDHVVAFSRYEERMLPFLRRKQEAAARFASAFAPRTAMGITVRNLVTRLMRIPFVADQMIGRDLRDDLTVPGYGFRRAGAASLKTVAQ